MFKLKSEKLVILVLFVTIGILLLLRQCTPSEIKDNSLNQKKDTMWIDTTKPPQVVIKFKSIPYPVYDSIKELDTLWIGQPCNFTRFYNDSLADSNLTIYSEQEVIGILKESNISYKLKVPIYIKETREIHDTKFTPNKWSLEGNGTIGGNLNTFNMFVGASLRVKKAVIGYNYGIIDKSHNIKIGYILYNSKK